MSLWAYAFSQSLRVGRDAARLILIFCSFLFLWYPHGKTTLELLKDYDHWPQYASFWYCCCLLPACKIFLTRLSLNLIHELKQVQHVYFLKMGSGKVFGIQICWKAKTPEKQSIREFHLSNVKAMFVRRCACCSVPYCQLSRAWPDREQAKGKSILFSVVNLSLRWTVRIPCWMPLKHAPSPVYFSWPLLAGFIASLLLFLHLLPFYVCFSLPFHQTGWQNHLCVRGRNGNWKGRLFVPRAILNMDLEGYF